jgi:protein-L-isoaspartate(D-aspartate) O-methyltransferase
MLDFAQARRTMVDSQLRTFDITDRAVLAAMGEVPRERFVPSGREELAYIDQNICVWGSQGVADARFALSPMVLARMIQALQIEPGQRVLDVAAGLGYTSAVLARLGAKPTALESSDALVQAATERLASEAAGILVRQGPIDRGSPEDGLFDAILINGAVAQRPEALLRQLRDGGRLACLTGGDRAGKAVLFVRSGDAFGLRTLFDAAAPELPEFSPAPGFVF